MSLLRNLLAQFVPVREQRRGDTGAAPLTTALAFYDFDLNGDESAVVTLLGGVGTLNANVEIAVSPDGNNFFVFPYYVLAATAGVINPLAQPQVSEVFNATGVIRVYCVNTAGMRKLRVRFLAHTTSSLSVIVNSDPNPSIHPYAMFAKANTLTASGIGVAGAAASIIIPAVAGLRHYIHSIQVTRNASAAALVAGPTPALVTTTNLPGAPILTFGSDAALQGTDKEVKMDIGSNGLAAIAVGISTQISCPAVPSVIWRILVIYRLGL